MAYLETNNVKAEYYIVCLMIHLLNVTVNTLDVVHILMLV